MSSNKAAGGGTMIAVAVSMIKCGRCGHGPYQPRKPLDDDSKCPKCHLHPFSLQQRKSVRRPTSGRHSHS